MTKTRGTAESSIVAIHTCVFVMSFRELIIPDPNMLESTDTTNQLEVPNSSTHGQLSDIVLIESFFEAWVGVSTRCLEP